jgi:hypothetical protein
MMIEFCGNCKVGAETKDIYPGTCPYYKKASGRHCANHRPLPYRPNDGRMVYIASAMRGDIEGNLKKAAAYCQAAAESGVIPIAPHLYFSSYLDDRIPEERAAGMEMGLQILKRCDELWVFGTPTEGMRGEIKLAKSLNIPILYIPEETINKILERRCIA